MLQNDSGAILEHRMSDGSCATVTAQEHVQGLLLVAHSQESASPLQWHWWNYINTSWWWMEGCSAPSRYELCSGIQHNHTFPWGKRSQFRKGRMHYTHYSMGVSPTKHINEQWNVAYEQALWQVQSVGAIVMVIKIEGALCRCGRGCASSPGGRSLYTVWGEVVTSIVWSERNIVDGTTSVSVNAVWNFVIIL